MVASITLTSSMRSNLSSLKSLASQMSTTQTRLSTGKKVNNALDNADSYYQARALTNRASDLDMLLDSMGQSIQTITSAVKGLEASGEILENAAVIAKQAYEAAIIPEKAWFEAQVGPNGAVVSTAQELKDAIAANKETICVYGKIDLGEITSGLTLKDNQKLVGIGYFGDFDNSYSEIKANLTGYSSELIAIYGNNCGVHNIKLNITASYNSFAIRNTKNFTSVDISDVDIKAVSSSKFSAISFYRGGGVYNISKNINIDIVSGSNESEIIAIDRSMSYTSTINISSDCIINYKSNRRDNIFASGTSAISGRGNVFKINQGAKIAVDNPYSKKCYEVVSDFESVINNASTSTLQIRDNNITSILDVREMDYSANLSISQNNTSVPTREVYDREQFDTVLSAYDEMVSDSSYQGVNLIKGGKLTTMFNEDRTHSYTINGKDMSLSGLGINTREWQTKDDIAASIKEIQNAMSSIRDEVSRLGNSLSVIETRMNFTDAMCDVLQTGADDLVLADMNEESANYLALQTRNNLAVNALALAAQSNNAVLKLF